MKNPPPRQHGFVTLLSVLILSAVAIAVTVSILLLGLGASRTSFALIQSVQARGLANACAEEALQRLRESVYYVGNEIKTFSAGTCTIQTISGTGNNNRTLQTIATVGTVQRKVKVGIAKIHPTPVITSWQEVADF